MAAVAGCGLLPEGMRPAPAPPPAEEGAEDTAPAVQPAAALPPADATTAEEFDTTSDAERAAAVAEAAETGGDTALGVTIASLGAVSEPGIWLKTPLVSAPAKGRVEYPEKGTAVAVDLIPLDGEPGAGSRMSLAAMRLIEADLTSLPEVKVFKTN